MRRLDRSLNSSYLGAVVSATLLLLIAHNLAASASPVGIWRSADRAEIQIEPCGAALCGHIVKAMIDPETGAPTLDKHNPDPARRSRPLTGVQILFDMRPDGPLMWSGRVYNDDDGKLYRGRLIELNRTRIRIEGCLLAICSGEELERVK